MEGEMTSRLLEAQVKLLFGIILGILFAVFVGLLFIVFS